VGKPKSKALATMSTNHQMVYRIAQLPAGTMWQGKVSKTVKLNGQRSKNHFQTHAKWNTR
jgi:hypothetical protein